MSVPGPDLSVHGLLLAAGAGSRMGRPKALVGDWLVERVRVLRDGGCRYVTVVLGARADEARVLLEDSDLDEVDGLDLTVVEAEDWQEGMAASLRTGLEALAAVDDPEDAALVLLVDLPDLTAEVVHRVAGSLHGTASLARASYDAVPGHPVLLGRDHWRPVADAATGDSGAKDYLAAREVLLVDCSDLATGADQDTPAP